MRLQSEAGPEGRKGFPGNTEAKQRSSGSLWRASKALTCGEDPSHCLLNSLAMGTWGPTWTGAVPYKQDGEGEVIPPVFPVLTGADQGTSLALHWSMGRKRQSSRSPLPPPDPFPRAQGPHFYRFTIEDLFMHLTTGGSSGQQISCRKLEQCSA